MYEGFMNSLSRDENGNRVVLVFLLLLYKLQRSLTLCQPVPATCSSPRL
jgi:hypothetical protein